MKIIHNMCTWLLKRWLAPFDRTSENSFKVCQYKSVNNWVNQYPRHFIIIVSSVWVSRHSCVCVFTCVNVCVFVCVCVCICLFVCVCVIMCVYRCVSVNVVLMHKWCEWPEAQPSVLNTTSGIKTILQCNNKTYN